MCGKFRLYLLTDVPIRNPGFPIKLFGVRQPPERFRAESGRDSQLVARKTAAKRAQATNTGDKTTDKTVDISARSSLRPTVDHLDALTCCAGSVQYRSNSGNTRHIMHTGSIRLPSGNMSCTTQIRDPSTLKDLDHELWWG